MKTNLTPKTASNKRKNAAREPKAKGDALYDLALNIAFDLQNVNGTGLQKALAEKGTTVSLQPARKLMDRMTREKLLEPSKGKGPHSRKFVGVKHSGKFYPPNKVPHLKKDSKIHRQPRAAKSRTNGHAILSAFKSPADWLANERKLIDREIEEVRQQADAYRQQKLAELQGGTTNAK